MFGVKGLGSSWGSVWAAVEAQGQFGDLLMSVMMMLFTTIVSCRLR